MGEGVGVVGCVPEGLCITVRWLVWDARCPAVTVSVGGIRVHRYIG